MPTRSGSSISLGKTQRQCRGPDFTSFEVDLEGIIDLTAMKAVYFGLRNWDDIRIETLDALLDTASGKSGRTRTRRPCFPDELTEAVIEEAEIPGIS
ncbi:MAG: hypothetical protein R2875_01925 [Desulfobacterales bacterium]